MFTFVERFHLGLVGLPIQHKHPNHKDKSTFNQFYKEAGTVLKLSSRDPHISVACLLYEMAI